MIVLLEVVEIHITKIDIKGPPRTSTHWSPWIRKPASKVLKALIGSVMLENSLKSFRINALWANTRFRNDVSPNKKVNCDIERKLYCENKLGFEATLQFQYTEIQDSCTGKRCWPWFATNFDKNFSLTVIVRCVLDKPFHEISAKIFYFSPLKEFLR